MGRRITIFAVTTLIAAAVGATAFRFHSDPIRRVIIAVGRQRVIETRLSADFEWAPLGQRTVARSAVAGSSAANVRGELRVLASKPMDPSDEAKHAAAMAMLLTGDTQRGLERFEKLADAKPHDAQIWSDLGAARYEAGVATGDAALVAAALAAADEALRLDASLPQALFNRAVTIERLGVREEARKAWMQYLAVEGTSSWAAEARERASHLAPIPFFMEDLKKQFRRLSTDAEAARETARTRPQEARSHGETVVLADWAAAAARGDEETANGHLRIARWFGEALARNHGECILQRAVRAIDDADDTKRQHLIRGHLLFREGQNELKADRAAKAQATLTVAVNELTEGGSPIRLLAEFFLAHTFHYLGDVPEARQRNQRLLNEAPTEFRAHFAQLHWHLGLGYQSDGDWGKALDHFGRSIATFEDLGERYNAAAVRELTAEIHDRNGDPQAAWRQRIISLQGIGRYITPRLAMTLDNIGRGATLRKNWPVALSFLQLAGDTAAAVDQPTVEVAIRLRQARVFAETGNKDAVHASVVTARAVSTKIEDEAARAGAWADIDRTEAMVAESPQLAVSLLTRAIDYHATRGRRVLLPELHLSRGRAYADSDRAALAAADFDAGIAEVEKHRQSLPPGESRWGTFDPAADLFEEAVAAAVGRGDAPAVFAYAERSRARELLETLGAVTTVNSLTSFNDDTALVEYFSLSDRLVIIAVSRNGIRIAEERVGRTALEKEAEAFRHALSAGSPEHHRLGKSLYRRLVAPVEQEVNGSETVVFVPGPRFPSVAFAALSTGSSYLIERHAIVVSPSASVYAQLASRKVRPGKPENVLVVANPATANMNVLTNAETEAAEVVRLYPHSRRLMRSDATVEAFRVYGPTADIIHMATHGVTKPRAGSGALVLTDGFLDSQTIASMDLPRTRAVVLAACDSARGPARAEGTISAARGFLAAGVPAVIATLWQIDDGSAAQFFPRVHEDLARGVAAAAAVRRAQIESIRSGEMPSLWAAVQCIGTDGG